MRRFRRGLPALALLCAVVPTLMLIPATASAATLTGGTAVLQFKGHAAQARLVSTAQRLGLRGQTFRRLPFVVVRGRAAQLQRLAALRGVVAAHMAPKIQMSLYQSGKLVFEDAATRQATYSSGLDGRGVNVAVVDTGVDALHPDLMNRVVENVKFVGDLNAGLTPAQAIVCPAPCNTDTTGGHGTHVAGIVAGDGSASSGFYQG